VGEAAPCGPQARGYSLWVTSLNYKGDIFYLFFRLQIHVFHTSPLFHFQIVPNFYFSDTTPFRFLFTISRFHVFTISSFHDRHTFIYYRVSLNNRQLTLTYSLRCKRSTAVGEAAPCGPQARGIPLASWGDILFI
jgi:hypothetical protein